MTDLSVVFNPDDVRASSGDISVQPSGAKPRMKVQIPVVEGQPLQNGIPTVVGAMPAEVLAQLYKVPYRDSLRKTGYQRKPQKARISKLKHDLSRGTVDIPTAILLNFRGNKDKIGSVLLKTDAGLVLELDTALDLVLYVVDGQHRVLAIDGLCRDDLQKWGGLKVQFVMMMGANEDQEMRQFYVVNVNAKSVKTDLALDLLKQQYDSDGKVMDDTIRRGRQWQVEGQRIVEELHKHSPIWQGKIQLANEGKGDSIIPAASFVSSLKPALSSTYFGHLSTDKQVRLLNAFWTGVREACRQPFEGQLNNEGEVEYAPDDYTLQKGIGVTVMHELLGYVVEVVRSHGESAFDSTAYAEVLEPVLSQLEGDNKDNEQVNGADFWLTAPKGGAAGGYSSSAGKRVLLAKMRGLLPDIAAG